MVDKEYVTYNQVHKLCQEAAPQILEEFKPQLMIAIGGGGYIPARILRSFLKKPGSPNIPIQAIGLSLYEELCSPNDGSKSCQDDYVERPATKVTRTQWLDFNSLGDMKNLIGKRILIVDEIDDTRTTLEYALKELEKDIEKARQKLGGQGEKTNKSKKKKGHLPQEMLDNKRYLAAKTVGDIWICYPWEATDIDEHDKHCKH